MSTTPGPWEYHEGMICHGDGEDRMVLTSVQSRRLSKEDAELIACAPDMLEIIKELHEQYDECDDGFRSSDCCSEHRCWQKALWNRCDEILTRVLSKGL